MKKYENTNFRVSAPEIVILIVFACLLEAAVFFYKSYSDVKGLFNIAMTEVDYIITAPSADQVADIGSMGHVNRIVPYYYRSVSVPGIKGNVASNLFIIEETGDLPYTTLSDALVIDKLSSGSGNSLYVTEEFAKNVGVGLGDTLQLTIDGLSLDFTVSGIYKSDYRHVGGTLITIMTDEISNAMKSAKYAGAFVNSSNLSETGNYFSNEYVPMGDIRSRDEFDSDDAYQTYLDTRKQSDTTKDAFVTADYIKELSRRNSSKLIRNILIAIACAVSGYLIVMLFMAIRSNGYTKANVLRDIKDNFTIEQETRMYKKYFFSMGLIMFLINVLIIAGSHIIGWINALSIINIAEVCATIILSLIVSRAATNKLKQRFLVENKNYEEGKRRGTQGGGR